MQHFGISMHALSALVWCIWWSGLRSVHVRSCASCTALSNAVQQSSSYINPFTLIYLWRQVQEMALSLPILAWGKTKGWGSPAQIWHYCDRVLQDTRGS